MKKIIITGVTGQDGSFMADYLLRTTEHTVIAGARRLSVSNHKNIQHLIGNPRFKLVDLDISDSQNVEEVIRAEKPDYFINFAANSFVGSSWTMPINHMMTNCLGVLYQLEAIRKFAPLCRYYNAGSSEEFGDVQYTPQDESHPLRPRSPYGASKAAARHLVKVYRDSYNLYAIQGWLFNHEGTRRGEEFVTRKITKGVARILKAIKKGEKFKPIELGNLEAQRDWSDAEDFMDGIWRMLNQEKWRENLQPELYLEGKFSRDLIRPLKDYVLSSGETHSIREFVSLAFEAAGIDGIWVGHGLKEMYLLPDYLAEFSQLTETLLVKINPEFHRPAEVELLLGDSTRARSELNWVPKNSFKDLVKKMVDFDTKEC